MSSDIRKYLTLRDSLIKEKAKLEGRLQEINEALGQVTESANLPQPSQPSTRGRRGPAGRASGGLSLRDAVIQVTSRGALTKEQILEGVKRIGYKFSTTNPLNSLGVILYGKNPKFKNDGGKFSPTGTASSSRGSGEAASPPIKRGRRKLSPEARERIAAAQRARWAKAKNGK
jgi:hypothetical protein